MALTAADIENIIKTNARNQTNTFNKSFYAIVDNTESGRGTGYFYFNFYAAASTTTFNNVRHSSLAPGQPITASGIAYTVSNAVRRAVDHIESRMGSKSWSYNFCHSSCHSNCHGSRGRR